MRRGPRGESLGRCDVAGRNAVSAANDYSRPNAARGVGLTVCRRHGKLRVRRLPDALLACVCCLRNLSRSRSTIIIPSLTYRDALEFCTRSDLARRHCCHEACVLLVPLANVDGSRSPFCRDHVPVLKAVWIMSSRGPGRYKSRSSRMGQCVEPPEGKGSFFNSGGGGEPWTSLRYDAARRAAVSRRRRDNPDPVVAYRKFAVTITLNEDYEGGELWFPEYGSRLYRGVTGGFPLVFSLHASPHEVKIATKGRALHVHSVSVCAKASSASRLYYHGRETLW